MYSRLAASMAFWLQAGMRRAAAERAEAELSVSRTEAARIVYSSLAAHALVEADSLRLIQRNRELDGHLPDPSYLPPLPGSTVFAVMETGAEDFAYFYLRKACRLNARAIRRRVGRGESSEAQQKFEELKRKWLWIQLGVDVLGTDAASLAEARAHLEDGLPLVAPYGLFRDASPLAGLVRTTRCTIVPMAVLRSPVGLRVHFGVASGPDSLNPIREMHDQMAAFVRRWPDHWSGWGETAVPRLVPLAARKPVRA